MTKIYDVIVVGGGPGGLAAASYAGRARISTLMIEKEKVGGQIVITHEIENYPGGVHGDSGASLIDRMKEQVENFGAETVYDTVTELKLEGDVKTVICKNAEYQAKTVILAMGAYPRPIGCPGEAELVGKGVSYCATCDAAFFEDMEVFVVGGGDSAVEEAMYLTKFARKVTIVHRRDELRAAKSIQEKAFANPKMAFMWDTVPEELSGDGMLEKALFKNVKTGEITTFDAPEEDGTFGVFVFIGYVPVTELIEGKIDMDGGYIVTDDNMKTNIPGVFAVGDIRKKSLRQVVTATADGAIAAVQCEHYINA